MKSKNRGQCVSPPLIKLMRERRELREQDRHHVEQNSTLDATPTFDVSRCPVDFDGSKRLFDKHSGLLTAKDVSQLLGVAEKSVYRWAKDYRIPYVNIGRCVRFRPEDIEAIRLGMRRLS
jgi:excisionase family DNA binding protein